jgi:hypothetical protein
LFACVRIFGLGTARLCAPQIVVGCMPFTLLWGVGHAACGGDCVCCARHALPSRRACWPLGDGCGAQVVACKHGPPHFNGAAHQCIAGQRAFCCGARSCAVCDGAPRLQAARLRPARSDKVPAWQCCRVAVRSVLSSLWCRVLRACLYVCAAAGCQLCCTPVSGHNVCISRLSLVCGGGLM